MPSKVSSNCRSCNKDFIGYRGKKYCSVACYNKVRQFIGYELIEKYCGGCDRVRPKEDFYVRTKGKLKGKFYPPCKECHLKMVNEWTENNADRNKQNEKKYWAKNKERLNVKARERNQEIRKQVLNAYKTKDKPDCECCGEDHDEFLCIDHINGGGREHRKELGHGGSMYYRWLVKNNFPDGFRILCHNCNHSRGVRGYCPHERKNQK